MTRTTNRRPRSGRAVLAAVAIAGVAASALVATGPAGAAGIYTVTSSANPDLPLSCGLDVVLVLDGSSSIATSGSQAKVQAAATAMLSAFQDTNTRIGIVKFSTVGVADVPLTYDTSASISATGTLGKSIATYVAKGQTNWEDALKKANGLFATGAARSAPKLIVLVTDGLPNTYDLPDGSPSAQITNGDPLAVDPAVAQSNLFKSTYGGHVLAVGVGSDFDSTGGGQVRAGLLGRVSEATNPQVTSPDSPAFDASTTDTILQPDVAAIGSSLRAVAGQTCQGSLTVSQSATSSTSPVAYVPAGAGWSVTATSDHAGDWLVPSGQSPSATSATVASDAGGTSVFQWDPATPGTRSAEVSVTLKPSYVFVGVTCTRNDVAIAGVPQSTTFTVPGGVGSGDAIACTVKSRWTGPLTTYVSLVPSASRLVYGAPLRFTGLVRSPLKVLPNTLVILRSKVPGSTTWVRTAYAKTTSKGTFSLSFVPRSNHSYIVTTYATPTLYAGTSRTAVITVTPKITAVLSKSGTTRRLSGKLSPTRPVTTVYLQRLVGRTWVIVNHATVSRTSTYSFTWTHRATYYYRVVSKATTSYGVGASGRVLG